MARAKLFIPGPIEVSEKTMLAFSQPMIGHRSKEFQALFSEVQPMLQRAFGTEQTAYVSTSSAWGMMEGAVRNLVAKKVLTCMSGAFSDKWLDVARKCGKEAEPYQVEWGQPILAEEIEKRLSGGGFDAMTLIHNETSTGTMNPLEEIAEVMRGFPDVTFIVDCVSSFTARKIGFDELGIDLLLAGTQKALALPAGACVFTASAKAYAKAERRPDRGYYFDLIEFRANAEKHMTPATPSISHFYALKSKLQEIEEEGYENRYARHREINEMVRDWSKANGFELFPARGYESVSLCCIKNTRNIDVAKLVQTLKKRHGFAIDGGYGKLKGLTFRISTMGDETPMTLRSLLNALDESLREIADLAAITT
jgi:aspartate aminotransferase-like enzyme